MLKLIPSVRAFGGRPLGKWLGHEGRALIDDISVLMKKSPERSLAPSAMWRYSKERAVYKPGPGPHWTLNLLEPWFWASQAPELRKKFQLCISHPVYGCCFFKFYFNSSLNGLRQVIKGNLEYIRLTYSPPSVKGGPLVKMFPNSFINIVASLNFLWETYLCSCSFCKSITTHLIV